jgi:hypothetical protein
MDWKDIPDWPNYQASSEGQIRNKATGHPIRQRVRKCDGYAVVDFYVPCIPGAEKPRRNKRTIGVHILVCMAFHGPRPSRDHQAAHGSNRNRIDNRKDNLRWATRLENAADKILHGTVTHGELNGCAKLSHQQVLAIMNDTRTQGAIAADYGVDRRTVGKIKNGQRWAHVGKSRGPAQMAEAA